MNLPLLALSLLLFGGEGDGLSSMFDVGKSSAWWTLIIFFISLPFMWKLVFGPILKALADRENTSRDAAEAAEAAKEEARKLQEAMKADLEEARREASAQVSAAKARSEEREKTLLASAKVEAEKERAKAQAEIDQALVSAREVLRRDAVELGMDTAEKVIGRSFADGDRSRLLADLQEEVSS